MYNIVELIIAALHQWGKNYEILEINLKEWWN
jgi:hypothetical protein